MSNNSLRWTFKPHQFLLAQSSLDQQALYTKKLVFVYSAYYFSVLFRRWYSGDLSLISGYRMSCNLADMDLVAIHNYISRSYWANNIPIETMKKAMNNSLCFGVFKSSGEQIAFARMITDSSTFAYLADVYVLEEHRGQGISKWLMREVIKHPELQGLRRITLATSDAHGLYKQFGFKALQSPSLFMELHQPNVYKVNISD